MRIRASFIAGAAALPCFLGGAHAGAEGPLLSADMAVARMSQQRWSRNWWEWAGSFARDESPIADRTGELCGSKQAGPVWFLAGTYGTQRTIRTCRVPKGKHLFFPLINYVVFPGANMRVSCAAVTAQAADATDNVSNLVLEIDGKRYDALDQHRLATTECFNLAARGGRGAAVFPAAANGYYVMLKPLAPGKHTLNFGAALPSMLQAVTYTLIVE